MFIENIRASGVRANNVKLLSTFSVQKFSQESISFQEKIIAKSGLGQETYLPSGAPDLHVNRVIRIPL